MAAFSRDRPSGDGLLDRVQIVLGQPQAGGVHRLGDADLPGRHPAQDAERMLVALEERLLPARGEHSSPHY
ncbi:hypothetical protein [Streptosporangium subroseum]|uniref:hypothetical protein n=1 Tax=Streptosporangium subroseum TaxID=106412 RepID=UPI0030889211|nr:hypothetical protein OHB15_25105 [Streptosporangium subroseum]